MTAAGQGGNPIACHECGSIVFARVKGEQGAIDYCIRCGMAHVLTTDAKLRVPLVPFRRLAPAALARVRKDLGVAEDGGEA